MQDHRKTTRSLLCLGVALGTAGTANAAFLDDSKATVELRNFYMNRDFRQSG
ncbi:OprD family outer membrane porin, partial [Stutzerimonas sp. 381-2]